MMIISRTSEHVISYLKLAVKELIIFVYHHDYLISFIEHLAAVVS